MRRRMKQLMFQGLGFYTLSLRLKGCCYLSTKEIEREEEHDDDEEEEEEVNKSPNWAELPNDILQQISKRLKLIDQIRINLVCKGWRGNKLTSTPPFLWMMLPFPYKKDVVDEESSRYLTFFDMREGELHKLKLPESAQGGWFCGASNGWLLHADGNHNWQTSLFDPISRKQIPLPSLSALISKFPNVDDLITKSRQSQLHPVSLTVDKVAVSWSNASKCVVAILFSAPGETKLLALCRPPAAGWTIVEGPDQGYGYEDILFSQDGNKLYACTIKLEDDDDGFNNNNNGGSNFIQARSLTLARDEDEDDDDGLNLNLNLILIPDILPTLYSGILAMDEEYTWNSKEHWSSSILVESESDGQLLLVIQIGDLIFTPNDDYEDDPKPILEYFQTSRFEVFEIQMAADLTSSTIVRVTTSSGLHHKQLFIGDGSGIAAGHFDMGKDNNGCTNIYFLERLYYSGRKLLPFRDSGVFNLDNARIKRSLPSFATERLNYRTWLSPNIKV